MLKAFSASSDVVVASTGTSNFWMEASDSPSLAPQAGRRLTQCFQHVLLASPASSCSLASVSPLLQPTASMPITYWPPKLEMEPNRIALLPVRTQSSPATSRLMRSFGGRPISRSVSPTLRSERMLRKGDCPSWTASACFKASSKTGSPGGVIEIRQNDGVLLRKRSCGLASANGSRSSADCSSETTTAAGTRIFQRFFPPVTELQ